MSDSPSFSVSHPWYHGLQQFFIRSAVSKILPLRWCYPQPPAQVEAKSGRLSLEIVSHCWRYAHLQAYQLSSLVQHPPQDIDVTMTVFYAEEDQATAALLDFFAQQQVPNVTWNWQKLSAPELFRRAIGRNQAALASQADWVWFTDCDVCFGAGALDSLNAQLQGCQELLVYPQEERVTSLLTDDSPMLIAAKEPAIVSIDEDAFNSKAVTRATGPLQITHGDVARRMGYCAGVSAYLRAEPKWSKCHEDRVFRWLLKTQGTPIDIPAVYRIRHETKGRYTNSKATVALRSSIRKTQERMK